MRFENREAGQRERMERAVKGSLDGMVTCGRRIPDSTRGL